MKNHFLLLIFFLLITSTAVVNAQKNPGQTVYFKNGSIIKGTVEQDMTTGKIKISTQDGSLFVYDIADVDSIVTTKKNTDSKFKQSGFWNVTEFTLGLGVGEESGGTPPVYGLSSVFGYQFFPQLTLGAGAAVELYYKGYAIPLFADVRYFPVAKRASPMIGLQVGYAIAGIPFGNSYFSTYFNGGLYLSPLVGAKIFVSKRVAINVAFSYQLRQFTTTAGKTAFYGNYLCVRLGVSF